MTTLTNAQMVSRWPELCAALDARMDVGTDLHPTPVTYHGSLTEWHGPALLVGDCLCPLCRRIRPDDRVWRVLAVPPRGYEDPQAWRVLGHVRPASYRREAA